MPKKPPFEEQLIISLARISNSISGLASELSNIDNRRRFPVGPLKPSKEYERAMRASRKEKREETQLQILAQDRREMVKQSRYMLWAVIVAAIGIFATLLWEIAKFVIEFGAKNV